MTRLLETARDRPGVVVLSIDDGRDRAHLLALEDAPDRDAVLCLVSADVDPSAEVQAAWHRLARRRFVLVLRHDGVWCRARRHDVPDGLGAVSTVARWVARRTEPGLRLMLLEPSVGEPAPDVVGWSEMHGFRIRGNVEVTTLIEGVRMTLAPDAPLPDPDVEPVEPTDPDDVPEVPLEPTPAPDETGIR
ncbi:MAG: hypothetical protein PGN15_06625 [Aeromicrobium erythreum]